VTENMYHESFPEFVCCFYANVELKFVVYEVVVYRQVYLLRTCHLTSVNYDVICLFRMKLEIYIS
jgi:hypothetical protein